MSEKVQRLFLIDLENASFLCITQGNEYSQTFGELLSSNLKNSEVINLNEIVFHNNRWIFCLEKFEKLVSYFSK